MKERWRISKEKLVAAEEGLKSAEPVTGGSICSCDRLIQYAKFVLYIELILFLGWSSYTLWQAYDQQTEIRFFNVFRSGAFHDVESSTVPTEVLKSWSVKDFKDTEDEIKTTKNSPFEKDLFPTRIAPTDDQLNVQTKTRDVHSDGNFVTTSLDTTTWIPKIKDSLESSKSDEDKEIIIKVPNLGASESNETGNSEESSVIEWGFPFLWSIHKESGPFTDDSSEAVREFRLDDVLDHLYESNEKDESDDIATFRQTSSEKGIDQRNEKDDSTFSSEEVPSFAEIVNNLNKLYKSIEAARKDLNLEPLRDDGFLESLKNSNKDETSDPPKSTNNFLFTWKPNNIKEPLEETTVGNIAFRNWSNEDESTSFFPWTIFTSTSKPIESEEFDTSKVDETGSAWNTYGWAREPSWFHDYEDHSGVEVEDKNKNWETITVATNEEDNDSTMDRGWRRPLVDCHGDTDPILGIGNKRFLQITTNPPTWFHDYEDRSGVEVEDKYKNRETVTVGSNEEDNDSTMDRGWWGPLVDYHDDTDPILGIGNKRFLQITTNPPTWFHDYEDRSGVEVEDKYKNRETIIIDSSKEDNDSDFPSRWESSFTITDEFGAPVPTENVESSDTTTNEEDNSSVMDSEWERVFSFGNGSATSWLTANEDSVTSNTTTNEEDNSSIIDSEWEDVPHWFRDVHKPSQVESVNSEQETIQFGPRNQNENLTESEPCTLQFHNGQAVLKCSWGSDGSDESSDSSHTTESESDSSTEDDVTSLGENDGLFDIIKKMHAQDNMESSDEKSDIYDSSVIDKEESIKPTSSPEDSSLTSTMLLYKIATTTASSMIKDSTVSPSQTDWHLSSEQTKTILENEDASVDKTNDETFVQKWMRNPEIMKETIQSFTNEDWEEIMTKAYSELLKAHNDTLHERFSQESQDISL